MKQPELLPQIHKQNSFNKIISFYQSKYNKKFLGNHSLSCHEGFTQRKLKNSPIIYNNAINYNSPRSTMKSYRKQTVRTIYLDKKNYGVLAAENNDKKDCNANQIKQKMEQRINYFSVKNQYDQLMKIAADQDLVERLKSELTSLPKPTKYCPRARKVNNLIQSQNDQFKIQGSKMKESNRAQKFKILINKAEKINFQNSLSFMSKSNVSHRTDFKIRMHRKSDGSTLLQKAQVVMPFSMEQLQASPLTGWV